MTSTSGLMDIVQAVVLGLVQGLTEFLPISSTAHVRIVAALAGWPDPGAAFTAVTQLGTESAVLLYFRRDLLAMVAAVLKAVRDPNARLGAFVVLGTVPIGVLGLAFQDAIETSLRDLRLIALALVLFAFVLAAADRLARNRRGLDSLTARDAVVLGFAEALALVPGVSRSGGTISAGLLLGFRREQAARYSFLLAVPAVLASGLLELTKIGGESVSWGATAVATVVAFGVGYLVIGLLLRFLVSHRFTAFVVYRVVVGCAVLALVGAGLLPAT